MAFQTYTMGGGLPVDPSAWLKASAIFLEGAPEEKADKFEEQRLGLLPYFINRE